MQPHLSKQGSIRGHAVLNQLTKKTEVDRARGMQTEGLKVKRGVDAIHVR